MYRYLFFDLDGTLTDSSEGIFNGIRYTVEKMGGPMPDPVTLKSFIGPPLQHSFMEHCGYDAEKALQAVQTFREYYLPIGQHENKAAPGLAELCARLKEKGFVLALASSKPEEMCLNICARFGFTPSMETITGSPPEEDWDKTHVIRETMRRLGLTEGDEKQILMIGDRKYDVLGAKECGIDCVGVEFFGYAAPDELVDAGAIAVAHNADELEQILEAL